MVVHRLDRANGARRARGGVDTRENARVAMVCRLRKLGRARHKATVVTANRPRAPTTARLAVFPNMSAVAAAPSIDDARAREERAPTETPTEIELDGARDAGVADARETPADATTSEAIDRDVALRERLARRLGLDVGTSTRGAAATTRAGGGDDDGDEEIGLGGVDGDVNPSKEGATNASNEMTQRELVERRLRRMRDLRAAYRERYARLLDDLEREHRVFEIRRGHAGSREAEAAAIEARVADDGETIGRATQCAAEDCDGAPLPCATFCFRHVTRCERQKLYVLGADGATRVREG